MIDFRWYDAVIGTFVIAVAALAAFYTMRLIYDII